MKRPEFAIWLKNHYWTFLRFVPFGGKIWFWADRRVEKWHEYLYYKPAPEEPPNRTARQTKSLPTKPTNPISKKKPERTNE